jgi:hypothetical protein
MWGYRQAFFSDIVVMLAARVMVVVSVPTRGPLVPQVHTSGSETMMVSRGEFLFLYKRIFITLAAEVLEAFPQ